MSAENANPRPPKHLSDASKSWWKSVVSAYELAEHHLKLLTLAAECWDRCTQAREAIKQHGLTFEDRHGARRPVPESAIEHDNKVPFARLVRELGLDVAEAEPQTPRPPRTGGQKH